MQELIMLQQNNLLKIAIHDKSILGIYGKKRNILLFGGYGFANVTNIMISIFFNQNYFQTEWRVLNELIALLRQTRPHREDSIR